VSEESTTPDLAELNRRRVEAWNRGDVDEVMSFFAPDAVWEGLAGDERLRGLTAIRGVVEDLYRPYEEFEMEMEEFCDLGNGVGFSVAVQKGRLVGASGLIQMRFATVALLEGDLIKRITFYTDIDEARAAAERLAQERE
jgi:ketosteroid isomerase-like protein